ncbi:DegT/DnrJ/EryC1/StrS family aminotransferase [Pseudoalteromonas nigrifaciens]|uniref:DegT/DnrJ/EryC1/StrS family aminotransferase n=1 Tax=Pseudoalteromonas nigrifaciens TaxID=28109 RepID=UPI0017884A84|nr:DegT/DnrJ/EryC1/StrS family aminotransferase [Pseudoalteromonas nigrifaciens]MBE0421899.1 DegT/DnrJ/EryC1/StrS family aminotransferase [Pseudoalteromonas nigrifaciens]
MDKITVTSPLLPPLDELTPYLEDIWQRKWLTNSGHYHQQLEDELCNYLDVPYISLFSNGTLALITALQSLELTGEVITTPYTFVATAHAIKWNNLTPVFVDIDPTTFNIDPAKIEAAITEKTSAILPVHVYGTPCDNKAIDAIAQKHGLKVIYDAAHAFAVKQNNQSVLNYGDLSILSFHATKAYSTIEGGAVVCKTLEQKQRLDQLKNFGFESETQISVCGMNAKLNELQAAFGLVALTKIDESIAKRKLIANNYDKAFSNIAGIKTLDNNPTLELNYSYYPILINEAEFGLNRDELLEKLQANNILARRYFYPLVTQFELYKDYVSSTPNAKSISEQVLCIPIHNALAEEEQMKVIEVICG